MKSISKLRTKLCILSLISISCYGGGGDKTDSCYGGGGDKTEIIHSKKRPLISPQSIIDPCSIGQTLFKNTHTTHTHESSKRSKKTLTVHTDCTPAPLKRSPRCFDFRQFALDLSVIEQCDCDICKASKKVSYEWWNRESIIILDYVGGIDDA